MSDSVLFEQRLPGVSGLLLRRIRCFEFRGDQLACWIEGPRAASKRQAYALKDIPAQRHFRDVLEPDGPLLGITLLSALAALVALLMARGDAVATLIVFIAGGSALAGMVLASALLVYKATYVPAGGSAIVVHRGKEHDAILAEMVSRKQAHFATTAGIDPDLSIRENLKNLRHLADIEVVPAAAYWSIRRRLAPLLAQQLPAKQAALQMRQRRYLTRVSADMQSDHLIYESRTFGSGGARFRVDYAAIPERSAIKETQMGSPGLLLALVLSGLFVALGADFTWVDPAANDIGDSLLFMMWGLMPLMLIVRLVVFPAQEFRPGFFVLQEADIRGDEILTELYKRRTAALRAIAAPDPVLTVAEQTARLSRFKEGGIINEAEFARFAAEATALDQPGLDLLPDAAPQHPVVLH